MTDTDYLDKWLTDHPAGGDTSQISNASKRDRGHHFMVHSRVADLRKRHAGRYDIVCQVEGKTRRGFPRYVYRKVSAKPQLELV